MTYEECFKLTMQELEIPKEKWPEVKKALRTAANAGMGDALQALRDLARGYAKSRKQAD